MIPFMHDIQFCFKFKKEPDILEANDGGACEGSRVPRQRLHLGEVHDLRNPNQASGRVPLHRHPPVEVDPLHAVVFFGKPRAHRVQKGDQACGGKNRQG